MEVHLYYYELLIVHELIQFDCFLTEVNCSIVVLIVGKYIS